MWPRWPLSRFWNRATVSKDVKGKENHFNLPVILSQLCNLRLTDFNAAGFIGGIFLISGKRESS